MQSKSRRVWITIVIMACGSFSCLAETYQMMDPVQIRKLRVVRHYEVAVQKGKPSAAAIPALMSFWGATNWQQIKSSRFRYDQEPDSVEVMTDNLGMPRKYYKLIWSAPKTDRITVEQTLEADLTCFNKLYTTAKFPYADEVKTRLAQSLAPEPKEGINPTNPQLGPICDGIVKRCNTAEEVVEAVCDWINENITFVKGQKTSDEALAQKQGSCTPMSRLACAMLRRIGIPTEVVDAKFIGGDSGHTFIEVYFPDAGWVFYDLSNWTRGFKSLDCLMTVGWSYRSGPPEKMTWHNGYFCTETDARPFQEYRKSPKSVRAEPKGVQVDTVRVFSTPAPASVSPRHQSLRQLILDSNTPPGVRNNPAAKTEPQSAEGKEPGTKPGRITVPVKP